MTTLIHPTAVIEKGAEIGSNVSIGAYSVIGANAKIGDNNKIESHVVISGHTTVGESNHFFPFAAIGGPPQSMAYNCLLYTSPSPRDLSTSRMPSSA